MNREKLCKRILFELLKDPENLSSEAKAHLDICPKCNAEYDEILKMSSLIKASSPKVPSLKDGVLEKIRDQKLTPAPISSAPRRYIPFGTISAAAAVLVIGLIVYKGDVLDKISSPEKDLDDLIVCDEEADLSNDLLIENQTDTADGDRYYFVNDFAKDENGAVLMAKESADEVAEAETEAAPPTAVNDSAQPAETDGFAEKTESVGIEDKGHVLSAAPPSGSDSQKSLSPSKDSSSDNSINDSLLSDAPRTEEVLMMHRNGVSGGAGATSPSSKIINENIKEALGKLSQSGNASEIYKVLAQYYPDRIPIEVFENADPSEYIEFVLSIEDFETEYTENAFLNFCGKMFFESFGGLEIL